MFPETIHVFWFTMQWCYLDIVRLTLRGRARFVLFTNQLRTVAICIATLHLGTKARLSVLCLHEMGFRCFKA